MSFEEQFDNSIRQMAEDTAYPFDEANWQNASRMIDADRKAAGAGMLKKYYIPAALVGLAAFSFVVLGYFRQDDSDLVSATSTQPSPAAMQTVEQPAATSNPAQANEAAATTNIEEQAGNQNQVSAQIQPNTGIAGVQAPVNETAVIPSSPQASKASSTQKNNSINTANINAAPLANTTATKKETTSQATVLSNAEPAPALASTPAASISKASTNPVPAKPLGAAAKTDDENNEQTSSTGGEEVAAKVPAPSQFTSLEATKVKTDDAQVWAFENLNSIAIYNSQNESELMLIPFILLPRYGGDYYDPSLNTYKTHFFNAELGANYNLGWQTSAGTDGKGFNWFGGFNYGYYISKKFALGAGLQVYNLQNTNQSFYKATVKEYDFGSTSTETVITSKNLMFVSIPVKIYYSVNSFNQVGLGFNASYLFDAKSNMQSYNVQDNIQSTPVNTSVSGIYKGTNQANFMLSAFYKLRLGKRVGVNTEFVYGLTDIFKNTGNIKISEKPIGFRLSLQYTLFER